MKVLFIVSLLITQVSFASPPRSDGGHSSFATAYLCSGGNADANTNQVSFVDGVHLISGLTKVYAFSDKDFSGELQGNCPAQLNRFEFAPAGSNQYVTPSLPLRFGYSEGCVYDSKPLLDAGLFGDATDSDDYQEGKSINSIVCVQK